MTLFSSLDAGNGIARGSLWLKGYCSITDFGRFFVTINKRINKSIHYLTGQHNGCDQGENYTEDSDKLVSFEVIRLIALIIVFGR